MKKIAIGLLAVGVVVAGIFYAKSSHGSKPVREGLNPAFGQYVASYTSGVISSASTIQIVFTRDMVDSTRVGKESEADLFSFDPSVKGKIVWLNMTTVEFRPEESLSSGKIYEAKFNLSGVLEVPEDLKKFPFSFQVIPQNYEVTIDNVKPYVKTELKRQKIEGTLFTADVAKSDAVEVMLVAKQESAPLKVSWIHTDGGKQHHFTVEDVERKDTPGTVQLIASGKSIDVDRDYDEKVEIPSLSDFKLVNAKVVQSPNQHVALQFSDPLKDKQNLKGLITIAGLDDLEFTIEENQIFVYPRVRQTGTKTIQIELGIRNILDYKMKAATSAEVVFEQVAPAVRFTGNGSILPSTDGLVLPFEAVNLNTVDVTITRVFEQNMLQFLQVNNYDGNQELYRVGRKVLKKAVALNTSGVTELGKWNRFTLNLAELINTEPGAIYQVKLSFRKSYSTYDCAGEAEESDESSAFEQEEDDFSNFDGNDYYYDEDYYYYDDYDWSERDNPCHSSYYSRNRSVKKNVLASDIGITAKRGEDGKTIAFLTDLATTQSLSGVEVELYNYQQQKIGSAVTGADGKVEIATKEPPFVLVARKGDQRGYLKLNDGEALSLSSFDVSGEAIQKGLKGFLYGDRGVWRPGDSLFLTFILEDKTRQLPANHPVVFELVDPQGQVANRLVRAESQNGFYSFATATNAEAPTGNWTGRVKAGGTVFSQVLKVETVKPNRLKINLDFGTEKFSTAQASANLQVNWLHGAPGRNLKATFEMSMASVNTGFPKYENYVFEDPSREFSTETTTIFDSQTDSDGKAALSADLSAAAHAPGFVNVIFRGKVFEESGNFSVDRFSIPYSPYESYLGMKTPEGEKYSGILYFDKAHPIELASVNGEGEPVSRSGIKISVYKLNWRWWWDNSSEGLANYVDGSYSRLVKEGTANTSNGKGVWNFEMKEGEDEYGRYFIRACDPVSGHCTGQIVYVDSPGWYSRMRDNESGGPDLLTFTTDKTSYSIGEKVNVTIPSGNQGRALISVESGSRVIETYWVDTQKGETKFNFEVTDAMTPNVYISISLLQPHSQTENDLPIRLYGVVGIRVENPETHLEPEIRMPEVLEPGEEVSITISEKSDRKMTYTVAVVDEGLLDITRFKTPDAWNRFYSREALGVRTWDLFDDVMGAFGTRIERVLAIGGDAELQGKDDDPRANRFKPVVKFFGPFTINGGEGKHTFVMPQYIGSVKTMVVAGFEGAYGKAEKATPVRKPLMVLATLPRVLGPQEKIKLPITLFTQEKSIRNVKIEIKTSGPLAMDGAASQTVTMSPSGDMTVDFDLSVKSEVGIGKVEVIASSGSFKATDVIEIDVRNPNLPVTKITATLLEAGRSWTTDVAPFGIAGTNTAILEVSNLPPVNLGSRLRYLIQYPHGCIEQTTSSVFPQLYLSYVKSLSEVEKSNIQRNVKAGIERLRSFVQRDGGFGYWPGADQSDTWGTTYAGHFLVEAEARGYFVPDDMMKRWKKYQKSKVNEWRRDDRYYSSDLMQAYRLYTLALANAAEIGAMNRLREQGNLSSTATWMLAASYAKAGQPETARKMIEKLSTIVKPYRELGYSYGSDVRDKALIMETLVLLNDKTRSFELLKEISRYLSDDGYWLSTQETAFCLKAIGSFAGINKQGELKFSYVLNGKTLRASTELPVAQIQIPVTGVKAQQLQITSESKGALYSRIIMEGTPAQGEEVDAENNLTMRIRYVTPNGADLDVTNLEQGTEFVAEVSVQHAGLRSYYENLALSQVFPSGWEINNVRLTDDEELVKTSPFNYQDIRDDRVYTYFGLSTNEKRTFRIMLTASFAGTYYLPATSCEAMYDKSIYARKKGQVVNVNKRVTQ